MHDAIYAAVQEKIEALDCGGVERVADAVRSHADASLLSQYDFLLSTVAGAQSASVRERTRVFPSFAPADPVCAPGSLGTLLPTAESSEQLSPVTELATLQAAVRDVAPIARAVIAYGEGEWADMALQAFLAAQVPSLDRYLSLAILFARVGFVDPEAAIPVYDAIATGWLHGKASVPLLAVDWEVLWPRPLDEVRSILRIEPRRLPDRLQWRSAAAQLHNPRPLPAGLPPMLWRVVGTGVDPAGITPSIAAFGMAYDRRLKDACARAVLLHEGQPELARQPWPARIAIDSLRAHAPGTLGHAYYHLIVDNGFDPEVLDPDSVTGFHPGLDGTNRRILQTHEVWHLVAGYSTSPLHETAISAFQLAQFGHNYSATFLATVTLLLILTQPIFVDPMLQVIAEGWMHGRRTRPLMLIDWSTLWDRPIDDIRRSYGIDPFHSVVPDLLASAA